MEIATLAEIVLSHANEKSPLRKHMYRKLGSEGFSGEIVAESEERLASCLFRVESALADGGPYLLGDRVTIPDILLMPTLDGARPRGE